MKRINLLPVVSQLINIIGGGLIGNGLASFANVSVSATSLICGVLLIVINLPIQKRAFTQYRRYRNQSPKKVSASKCPVLILLLSHVRGEPVPKNVEISGDLQIDLEALARIKREQHEKLLIDNNAKRAPFWPWEQPLRACYPLDIVNQIRWSAQYAGQQPVLSLAALTQACHNYFLAPGQKAHW